MGGNRYDDGDWTDPAHPRATAYDRSKTLAERAAWEFVQRRGARDRADHDQSGPGLRPADGRPASAARWRWSGGSCRARTRCSRNIALPVVDVRDVAEMHLRALQRPGTGGKRYIASAGTMAFPDMARALKAEWPDRRIGTRTAPNFAIRLVSLWDRDVRTILPSLGWVPRLSAERAEREMEMQFIPPEDALRATAEDLIRRGLV
jgi:dihydroflavonol-4-reductase